MSRWIASGVVALATLGVALWACGPVATVWAMDGTGKVWQLAPSLEVLQTIEGFRSPGLGCPAADGGVWVVDRLKGEPPFAAEIVRLGPGGDRRFAVAGFSHVVALAPVPSGGAWIADRGADELLRLSDEGRVVGRWQIEGITSVQATGRGDQVVIAMDRGRVLFLQPEQHTPLGWQVGGRPIDVAPARDGGLWVLDGDYPGHLIRLDHRGNELQRVPTYLSAERMAVDERTGDVWLASTSEPLVRCFGEDGLVRFTVDTPVAGLHRLRVDEAGSCWLSARDRVLKIAADGSSIEAQGAVERPTDVVVP